MGLSPTSSSPASGGVQSFNTRTGAVTLVAADVEALFDAAGHVFAGTGAGTGALVYPPGYEFGYDQITAPVNITGTSSAAPTSVITAAAHTFDGGAVVCEFFAYAVELGTAANTDVSVALSESGAIIAVLALAQQENITTGRTILPMLGRLRFTPTAAAHTYTAVAWTTSTTGTPSVDAGAGTAGAPAPAYLRFTKV